MYRKSQKVRLDILRVLAEKKEYAQYDLPSLIGKDYRTVLRYLQNLEKAGLIELSRMEPAAKGGKDRKIFTLTFRGILNVLIANPDKIQTVAGNFPNMLLAFKKWRLFEEAGLKEELQSFAKIGLENLVDSMLLLHRSAEFLGFRNEDQLKNAFDGTILFMALLNPKRDEAEGWAKVCMCDGEIKRFIDSQFKNLEKDCRRRFERITWWRSLEKES